MWASARGARARGSTGPIVARKPNNLVRAHRADIPRRLRLAQRRTRRHPARHKGRERSATAFLWLTMLGTLAAVPDDYPVQRARARECLGLCCPRRLDARRLPIQAHALGVATFTSDPVVAAMDPRGASLTVRVLEIIAGHFTRIGELVCHHAIEECVMLACAPRRTLGT